MHLHLPRRYRRRLLFPPGLLALAGLLWLGCVALQQWEPQLRLRSVMLLTMPTLPLATDTSSYNQRYALPPAAKIHTMGPWRTHYLTGKPNDVGYERARVITDIRAMVADSIHNGRICISLRPTARYKDLVFLLDVMNRENVKKYWLDIMHTPTTVYAFTKKYRPEKPVRYADLGCLLCNDVIYYTPPQPTPAPFWEQLNNWVTDLWHLTWLSPLLQPEWRVPAWLLAAIVALGGWRILGPWRATQAL